VAGPDAPIAALIGALLGDRDKPGAKRLVTA
jgi:hypothetical protein